MAILHQATLVPTKLELICSWLPAQSWFESADASGIELLGVYRFDDPDGEVGIETLLLKTSNGLTLQIPVTYRGAALDGAASFLIGTTEHSVLGKRWVYDGCGDVVYLTALATTILNGGHEADLDVVTDKGLVRREATTKVTGNGAQNTDVRIDEPLTLENRGSQTYVSTADFVFTLCRVIEESFIDDHQNTLSGTWVGRDSPARLVSLLTR